MTSAARRDVLKVGAAALLATSAAGCDLLSREPASQGRSAGVGPKGPQAPMLAELVDQGSLPPVEQRLPAKPLVVEAAENLGVYGGTWRCASNDPSAWAFQQLVRLENLVRFDNSGENIVHNVAESFEISDDGTAYTFRLHRGIIWSDGEQFTTDDIMFWYEDVARNEELSPDLPRILTLAHTGIETVEKLDDYTVRFVFPVPNGLFLQRMASPHGASITAYPRHYLEEFHKSYNNDVEQLVEAEGMDDWIGLFGFKASGDNTELPTLSAWHVRALAGDGGSRSTAERNPYYWKVDTEGSQLPYIDRVEIEVMSDVEAMTLKALNGDIDMQTSLISAPTNKPLFSRDRERGDYRFFDVTPSHMNTMLIQFNLTHQDPVRRTIFQNKDFRIGLSHAINRQEIIDTVLQRQGEPWQCAPRPESDFYDEEMAKQYTEYDVGLANEFLDRSGYAERDSDGIRLGPDGSPISFPVQNWTTTAGETGFNSTEVLELIRGYWRDVGVDMHIDTIAQELANERMHANEQDVYWWKGDGGLEVLFVPQFYFAYGLQTQNAYLWGLWYETGGEEGERPPALVRRQMDLYTRVETTVDEAEQASLMKELLQITKEEFHMIGISLPALGYGIVKNNFHGLPKLIIDSYWLGMLHNTNPEQYYIDTGE